jgi:ribonucleoside-diphosphate reductase alpha chain
VPPALEALGYRSEDIDRITAYATGHKTLESAPAINPKSLAARGFTPEALAAVEEAVKTSMSLEGVFSPWVLGSGFIRKNLKIEEAVFSAPDFSLLKHLGFGAGDIEAAELYACGTMGLEGAPGLK